MTTTSPSKTPSRFVAWTLVLALGFFSACSRSETASESVGENAEPTNRNTTAAPLAVADAASMLSRLDPPAAADALAAELTVLGEEPFLTWFESTENGDRRLVLSRFREGAWSEPVEAISGDGFFVNWADRPGILRLDDKTLIIHWLQRHGDGKYDYGIRLGRSVDDGRTWQSLGPLHDDSSGSEYGFVAWLPDPKGARAVWLDGRRLRGGHGEETTNGPPQEMELRTTVVAADVAPQALAENDGSVVLDPRVCECCAVDAARTADGPIIAYRDRSAEEIRDVYVVRFTAGAWSEPIRVHADDWTFPACPVNGPAVVADGEQVAVAWYTGVDSDGADKPRVQIAFSSDAGASFDTPYVVDEANPVGRLDLARIGDGSVVVSWLANEGEEAPLRIRRFTADGAAGDTLEIARLKKSRSSGVPRMERLGDRLFFLWTDVGEASKLRAASLSWTELFGRSS